MSTETIEAPARPAANSDGPCAVSYSTAHDRSTRQPLPQRSSADGEKPDQYREDYPEGTNVPDDLAMTPLASASADLQRAVDAFQRLALVSLSGDELVAALDVVETQSRRLPSVRDALVAEAKFRGVAEAHGFRSTSTWLRDRFVITKGEAFTWLQGADRLTPGRTLSGEPLEPALPATAAARAAGALSAAQVKVIDDLDDELPRELPLAARRDIETAMVRHAATFDATKLTQLGQRLLDTVDPDGTEPSAEEAHRRRGVTIGPLRRGLARISGHVDAWTREAILAVLASLSDPDPSQHAGDAGQTPGAASTDPGPADPREGATSEPTAHKGGVPSPSAERTQANAGPHDPASATAPTTPAADVPGEDDFDADWDDEAAPAECWWQSQWSPTRHHDDSGRAADARATEAAAGSPRPNSSVRSVHSDADHCPKEVGAERPGVNSSAGPVRRAQELPPTDTGAGRPDLNSSAGPVRGDPDDQPVDLPADRDRRLHPQRLHDALRDACERLLASRSLPRRGGTPATILLTVPLDTLERRTGLISTAHGGDITVREVIRRAGDATIIPVVVDREGNPLFLGRKRRLATPAQRYALHVRDGGCAIPGCMTPSHSCQTHHLIDWALGGPTDITNMTLLCSYHHHRISDWTLYLKHGRVWCVPPTWVDRDQTPRVNTYFRESVAQQLDLEELASFAAAIP